MLARFAREERKGLIGREDERHDCLVCSFEIGVAVEFARFLFLVILVFFFFLENVGLGRLD